MKLFKVKGNSMYPVLRDNDLVVVKETEPESLRLGNIVVYHEDNGQYIVHRLVQKGKEDCLYLKGDGYNLPQVEANEALIVGKAVGFVRHGHYEPLKRNRELHTWSVSLLKQFVKRFMRDAFRPGRR